MVIYPIKGYERNVKRCGKCKHKGSVRVDGPKPICNYQAPDEKALKKRQ